MASILEIHADLRAHRLRQDARGISGLHRPPGSQGLRGALRDTTEVVYVSPLKALGNDIQKTWKCRCGKPRAGRGAGLADAGDRTAVRTGDTLAPERRAMLARPPHILVTTPESLYILLTAEKAAVLRAVETVIVDEIHAVADDKRGAHLALSLERLEALVARPAAGAHRSFRHSKADRIGGQFLAGSSRAEPVMVNIGHRRALDLAVEVPAERTWTYRHQRNVGRGLRPAGGTGAQHRSTLVFVNTRRLSERMAHHLAAPGRGGRGGASRQPGAQGAPRRRKTG